MSASDGIHEPGTYVKGLVRRVATTRAAAVALVFQGFKLEVNAIYAPEAEAETAPEAEAETAPEAEAETAPEAEAETVTGLQFGGLLLNPESTPKMLEAPKPRAPKPRAPKPAKNKESDQQ